ncbi:hypothetical protein P7B02_02340 [Caulobacter segnis]|uniref:hypothetical protein n=1 Tax=Caulobacter segnis TaxID=88688 RepID=UPI0024107F0D|nr:hypothetical protein [Caulobacter segnis]MDG2520366.1 hypothetical protein [Caulobacter segnis]
MKQPLNDQKEERAPSGMKRHKVHPLIWLVLVVFLGWGAIALSQCDGLRPMPGGDRAPQDGSNNLSPPR